MKKVKHVTARKIEMQPVETRVKKVEKIPAHPKKTTSIRTELCDGCYMVTYYFKRGPYGELLAEEKEGELRFRITDRRFRSLSELLRFVRRHAGETEARRLSGCFAERDGTLCFLVGTDGRIIKDIRRNIQCDSQRLTFSITYQNQTRSRNGIIRSDVSFVRKDDIWRLDALIELRAR